MYFSDMMSSSRGPGVIGLVMALVVVFGFGSLYMFVYDDKLQGGGQTIGSLIARQGQEIESERMAIENGSKALEDATVRTTYARDLALLKRETTAKNEKIDLLKNKVDVGKAGLARQIQAFEDCKTSYRTYARGKAKGETLATLETLTGVVYKNVSFRGVTAIGIDIRHDDGHKRIPYEELPAAMQDRFQFDKEEKQKAMTAETAARNVHEASVAVAEGVESVQMEKNNLKNTEANRQRINQNIAAKEAQVASLKQDIVNLQSEKSRADSQASSARAAGRVHIKLGDAISGDIQSKQNRIAALQSEINQLQSQL